MVVIVSAAPGDGKTTVARNLAIASAMVGSRVLFIEADLRRPAAAKAFGIAGEPGVAEVLIGAESLDGAVQRVESATARRPPSGSTCSSPAGCFRPTRHR